MLKLNQTGRKPVSLGRAGSASQVSPYEKGGAYFLVPFLIFTGLIGCSYSHYLWHVSYHQLALLNNKVPLEEALKREDLTKDQKKKLKLINEIKHFAIQELKWDIDKNIYSSYVHLDRPYVSWLLRVAPAYSLESYRWWFPVAGSFPYKGFFKKQKALDTARDFKEKGYDTYVRGVSAYSTLRWFEDPVLSSMLSYRESDFVVTVFHELAHTVLFFKNHINFNERFAEFVGRKSALLFYLKKHEEFNKCLIKEESECPHFDNSKKSIFKDRDLKNTVKQMEWEWEDELLFSSFMLQEYSKLKKWYEDNKGKINTETKQKRLSKIQARFLLEVKPQLKTSLYDYFSRIKLNNARLLSYRSYNYNMEEFEKLFNSPLIKQDLKAFINYLRKLKNSENPEKALSTFVTKGHN